MLSTRKCMPGFREGIHLRNSFWARGLFQWAFLFPVQLMRNQLGWKKLAFQPVPAEWKAYPSFEGANQAGCQQTCLTGFGSLRRLTGMSHCGGPGGSTGPKGQSELI